MTMSAAREGENVKISINYGPVYASVTEQPGHARSFHGQLGRLLDEVEGVEAKTPEQRAREGHARFAASVDAAGSYAEPQPAFDEQPEDIRRYWVAVFSE
jgi:hypothetical protein